MKKSILIVEDDGLVRDILKCALEREYTVLEASRYSEAVGQLKNPLDLAIIDYDLPELDGFDVLEAIREAIPALPAIIITAYSHENLIIRALRAGATDYIRKPLCLKYLRSRLSEILEEREMDEHQCTADSREHFIIDGISLYIEENYMKELTRKTLTDIARMNRNKFSKAFKNRCGLTFKAYLRKIRIRNAVELLKNPDLRIMEIADLTGYGDVTHFERVFRQECQMSPQQYRNMWKTDRSSQTIST